MVKKTKKSVKAVKAKKVVVSVGRADGSVVDIAVEAGSSIRTAFERAGVITKHTDVLTDEEGNDHNFNEVVKEGTTYLLTQNYENGQA